MTSTTASRFEDRDGRYIPPERLPFLESSDGALILSAYLRHGWVLPWTRKWGDSRKRAQETLLRLTREDA